MVSKQPRRCAISPPRSLAMDLIFSPNSSLPRHRAARSAILLIPSRWPVRGGVNSEFGNRLSPWTQVTEFHNGLDINANQGTPVRAPAAGTVTFAGAQPEFGILVIIEHENDVRSMYGHLSKTSVKQGDWVQRGGVIGFSGNTGRSSGPHLHYEILVKGQPVNPRAYLWD